MNPSVPTATGARRVWLRVGTMLDGVSTAPRRDVHLVYDKDRIHFVGEESPVREMVPGQQAPDADLPEATLLPGLIDAHTHLFLEGGELDPAKRSAYLKQAPEQLLKLALPRLEKLLRLGVIGCRDAGDKDGVGLALSKLSSSPQRPLMPYVDSPGAAIHHRGRYGSFMAGAMEDCGSCALCVQERVRAGADRIKLIATGIIDFRKGAVTSTPQLTTEEIRALVAAARSFRKQTLAHASGDDGIERAIDGGVDTIEHGFFVREDQLERMRDRNLAWVPTFAPVQKQLDHAGAMRYDALVVSNLERILERHAASLVWAHRLGVTILAGSDAGSYGVAHGVGLLDELELMERAGLSSMAVIDAATGAASQRLAFHDLFGQIRAGFRPRFIVTCHSPLDSVANLRKPATIVFDGDVLDRGEIPDAAGL
ncbi:MAG: amidohydrolase family protein [Acidobacteriota bacterium]